MSNTEETPQPINIVSVSVDLDRLMQRTGDDPEAFVSEVINRAATRMFESAVARRYTQRTPPSSMDPDDGGEVLYTVGQEFTDRVKRITDEQIVEAVKPAIQTALETAPSGRRNPDGSPQTLADLIAQQINAAFNITRGDPYSSRPPKGTLLEQIIGAAVDRTLRTEWQEAIDAGKAEIKTALQANAAELLAATIAKVGGA